MNKKLIFTVIAAFVLALSYFGTSNAVSYLKNVYQTAQTTTGEKVLHPGALLKSYYNFSSATEAVGCTGTCALYDIITMAGADGDYLTVRSSGTADGSGTAIFSQLEFDGTGIAKSLAAGNPNAFPIVSTNGLTLDITYATTASTTGEVLMVYKDLD